MRLDKFIHEKTRRSFPNRRRKKQPTPPPKPDVDNSDNKPYQIAVFICLCVIGFTIVVHLMNIYGEDNILLFAPVVIIGVYNMFSLLKFAENHYWLSLTILSIVIAVVLAIFLFFSG